MMEADDLEAVEMLLSTYETELRILRTLGEVAAVLGVQPQTVRTWRMESPPMPGEPGRYDLDQIEAWKSQRALRGTISGMPELNVASQRAELARRLESVRGKQLKNVALAERVVSRQEVQQDLRTGLSMTDARLQELAAKAAANVPAEVAEVVRDEVKATVEMAMGSLRNELGGMLKH